MPSVHLNAFGIFFWGHFHFAFDESFLLLTNKGAHFLA